MTGIAVIGTGYWGKNHVRTYCELKDDGIIDCVKICDIDEKRAKELADSFGIEYEIDYKKIIADSEIQAVSIVTPSKTHFSLAKEFMEAGMDVLVEKPMSMDIGEAKDLVDISSKTQRILMVGHIFRYHPAVAELKRRIDRGEFGHVQFMMSNRLSYGAPRRDMGVVYALGVHEVDLFCHLLNREYPTSILASASYTMQKDIEDSATIVLDFDGIKGYSMESWLVPVYGKKRDLVVVGSEKSAKIDYLKPQELEIFDIRMVDDNGFKVESEGSYMIPIPYKEPLKEELAHFVHCVETRDVPLADAKVGMRAVEMSEGVLESIREGCEVKF
ncbi:MAG: Gfo/Idh/MocA family oxidoreductase [Methanosarcinales archaeon]|nr:Gfo/Idh/MocA family oxidoreductase [Methanosarcinales archaeon]